MPVSAPVPSSSSSTVAWNVVAVPSPRLAAHTDTAEPPSISRPWPITPPAPQPIRPSGASTSWIASSGGFGRREDARRRRRRARARSGAPLSSTAAAEAASSAAVRASGTVERPVPMRTGMSLLTILRAVAPGAGLAILLRRVLQVIAVFGPTGVGKTAVAIALAERLRARGEDPVAVSADAMQVYAGLPILTGAAERAASSARLEHRLLGFVPITQTFSAGRLRRARARRDRRAARARPAADRRRRHRPVPARRARRARPQAARRPRDPRRAGRTTRARSRRCTPTLPPDTRAGIEPDRPPAHPARATSCSRPATSRRRPRTRRRSCGPRRRATRRCWPR